MYALFGHPVNHSLSPTIHGLFAAQFDLPMCYTTQDATLETFISSLKAFRSQGGLGGNITVPLKEAAYNLCEKTSPQAQRAKAVNTIYWDKEGKLCGDNTDGIGFLRDLKDKYPNAIKDRVILVLGAGGAASGIIPPLLDEHPKAIYIVNRTENSALKLAQKLDDPSIHILSVEQLYNTALSFDIIINASSASLKNELFPVPSSIIKNKFVYDLVYNLKQPTVFVQWAKNQGASSATDGLGMLIEQAAEAFYVWHQKRPDTQSVYLYFRQEKSE